METKTFVAMYTIDKTGTKCCDKEGWRIGEYSHLNEALAALKGYAGGYVKDDEGFLYSPEGFVLCG